jgi:hypothetical protein
VAKVDIWWQKTWWQRSIFSCKKLGGKKLGGAETWWQNLEDNSSQIIHAPSSNPSWISMMPNRLLLPATTTGTSGGNVGERGKE